MPRKPGPKTELPPTESLKRVTVGLDTLTLRKLEALGRGNLSRGVRFITRHCYEEYQRERLKIPEWK